MPSSTILSKRPWPPDLAIFAPGVSIPLWVSLAKDLLGFWLMVFPFWILPDSADGFLSPACGGQVGACSYVVVPVWCACVGGFGFSLDFPFACRSVRVSAMARCLPQETLATRDELV